MTLKVFKNDRNKPLNVLYLLTGCAFVTFRDSSSAFKAQDDLHDQKTLPGVGMNCQILIVKSFWLCFPAKDCLSHCVAQSEIADKFPALPVVDISWNRGFEIYLIKALRCVLIF